MKNSVALLIAARTELAVHDDHDTIVTNLCRTFNIGADDAIAAIAAAQLLVSQPGQHTPLGGISRDSGPAPIRP
jgi:hypothetical protein